MNYLAHIYLSGEHQQVQIGNFIADFIKGKPAAKLHPDVVFGIQLHRKIDRYTDTHDLVKKCRSLFFDEFRHYSGVITDILFDYFLAKNWSNYSTTPLDEYVQSFYDLIQSNLEILPTPVQRMYPYMVEGNWLFNYRDIEGIERILFQLNKRTSKKPGLENSVFTLRQNHAILEQWFFDFFEDLQNFVSLTWKETYPKK